jgi:hypothetical protein
MDCMHAEFSAKKYEKKNFNYGNISTQTCVIVCFPEMSKNNVKDVLKLWCSQLFNAQH